MASALELLVGGWLVAAPFVLGYGWTAATWDDVIVGALVAVLAVGRLARPARSPELSWVATLLGLWLFTWAFWADRGATAMWNDAVAGGLVAVFALVSASASEPAPVDPAEER
ncbi:MAG TPA: SPW repeat protein [Baekduia sp.]|nr:SPW repeat protein [Baekduia sp.]